MCSVGDDFEIDGERHMPAVDNSNLNSICNKCREEKPIILLRSKDAYCKCCFLAGTNHKFKALLGKSRLLRPNDRVLISYEVGHPSTALLHLLRTGLDLNTPKKLRFEPIILFLEDQYHLTLKERHEMVTEVISQVQFFSFKLHLMSFKDFVLNKTVILDNKLDLTENDNEHLNLIIKNTSDTSTKKEIVSILRREALISAAKKLCCKFIFTPELSINIASNLLVNISLGRGSQVPVDTGFCDARCEEIKILRPLRLFDMKELGFYNILHHLKPISVRQPQINHYKSIQDLMSKFVKDLQENYPATVTTIVKTGDKLALDESKVSRKCKLCKGIILKKTGELDSEESTNFSKLVSSQLPDHSLSMQEQYRKLREKFDNTSQVQQEHCFSCSKISEYIIQN